MAAIIKEELDGKYSVDMMPVAKNLAVENYDAVIIGSPLRWGGFSRPIRKFIRNNRTVLGGKKVFCYLSVLYIVKMEHQPLPDTDFYVDPSLEIETITDKEASLFDKKHTLWYYHSVISKTIRGMKIKSTGFFHGRLIVDRLGLVEKIIMKIITSFTSKEREGEFLNPAAVREWARGI
jgi:menaquinone-dependent protoporphyrinogen IX oxidase